MPKTLKKLVRKISLCYYKAYMKIIYKQGGMSMVSALTASNNFIKRSIAENVELTPMKLQKLLYFLYARYLFTQQVPLFKERFATWKYGPVIPEVYNFFSHYTKNSIDDYYYEGDRIFMIDETNSVFREIIDLVWENNRDFTGTQLSNITHQDNSAWSIADAQNNAWLLDTNIMKDGEVFFE